ncbi:hypothetical protein, partial [Leclercia sp. Colony189]|uniref:hypothetical protein n=1 Tax=Leclercia sp. Colony189 TaxID=2681309 RepID=UPI001BDD780F
PKRFSISGSVCIHNYIGVEPGIHFSHSAQSVDFLEASACIQRKHYSIKAPINFSRIPFRYEKKRLRRQNQENHRKYDLPYML